jgi:very-short-patch-repair endonuclease
MPAGRDPRNRGPRPADNRPMTASATRPGRRTMSAAEAVLWSHLRDRRLEGWRFLRRTPAAGLVTFVCPDAAVTIQLAAEPGPLAFTSHEVLAQTESVLQAILLALRTALARQRNN